MKEATRLALPGSRSLRTFRFSEDLRPLWKSDVGPTLTFVNAVLCWSSCAGHAKKIRQRSTEQPDLGVHGFVKNKAVKEDMGWSLFEEYEAVPKLALEKGLSLHSYRRWSREVLKYVFIKMSQHQLYRAHQTPRKFVWHDWSSPHRASTEQTMTKAVASGGDDRNQTIPEAAPQKLALKIYGVRNSGTDEFIYENC
ncbi:hypothetical protein HPB48_026015 [Haemaphysalis longicornis]|uniref:Uncharacterized protein n=1 Tax=Haemaphysalis longicornis TaxID=44386 RepID=A0A9J6HB03_HAELO|nr:hypothetical protein HPB48_026015 [Haemaphysalis longicornis]